MLKHVHASNIHPVSIHTCFLNLFTISSVIFYLYQKVRRMIKKFKTTTVRNICESALQYVHPQTANNNNSLLHGMTLHSISTVYLFSSSFRSACARLSCLVKEITGWHGGGKGKASVGKVRHEPSLTRPGPILVELLGKLGRSIAPSRSRWLNNDRARV